MSASPFFKAASNSIKEDQIEHNNCAYLSTKIEYTTGTKFQKSGDELGFTIKRKTCVNNGFYARNRKANRKNLS